ncbi:MAG: radical SAM family heme chaperone HemW [Sulfuritalea sp.]|nr:radical SAM family heme chaperone HemW [Sulfuritalea sp.]
MKSGSVPYFPSTVAVSPAPTSEGSGLAAPPPLALYVHWPWCVKKCPYCDFNSHEARTAVDEPAYLAALIADLEAALPQIWNRPVISIFIGGGTPSLMRAATVDALLAAIRMRVPLHPGAEITLEANPGTAEAAKFAGYRDAGVNRLSVGVQSFDDAKLAALGRIHDSAEARRAIDLALKNFERVNLDLMYALPGQTLAEAERDIATAIRAGVRHISAYHLTLEPNTPFHHAPPPLPDDDLAADMQEMVEARLAEGGFTQYETSAFARPAGDMNPRCQHNLNYWTFGDYLGIGAGAHSKLSNHELIWREARHRNPRAYLEGATRGDFIGTRQPVARADLPGEFMMNALRLNEGFLPRLFTERTGLPLAVIEESALAARRDRLLETADGHIRPTLRGRRFLNQLLAGFLT